MTIALPMLDDLPPELVDDMAALGVLNDTALWRVARDTLSPSAQARLDLFLGEKSQGARLPPLVSGPQLS